jgi:predicted DNA repair protein MutK
MPAFLRVLTTVGTAAMLWVGGSIVRHGLEEVGFAAPAHLVHDIALAIGGPSPALQWVVTATLDGAAGLVLGLALLAVLRLAGAARAALTRG